MTEDLSVEVTDALSATWTDDPGEPQKHDWQMSWYEC
jgi:hypothetical protein